jgi:hypothetical protein
MTKLSKVRKWSGSRKRRVFISRSAKKSETIIRSAIAQLRVNSSLSEARVRELSTVIASIILKEINSPEFIKFANSFPIDVVPEKVENMESVVDAVRTVQAEAAFEKSRSY